MKEEKIIDVFVKIYEERYKCYLSPHSEVMLGLFEKFSELENDADLLITVQGFMGILAINYNDSIVEARMVDEFLIANIDHCYLPECVELADFTEYYYRKLGKE